MAKRITTSSDPVVAELTAIKRLLILDLLRSGLKQRQIAAALGVHESVLSRELPKGIGRALKNGDKA